MVSMAEVSLTTQDLILMDALVATLNVSFSRYGASCELLQGYAFAYSQAEIKAVALQGAKCLLVQSPIWSFVFLKVFLLWVSPAH